jgi:hypothetical protein
LRCARHDPAEFLRHLGQLGFEFSKIDERLERIVTTSAAELLSTLNEHDEWSATNIICSRTPLRST